MIALEVTIFFITANLGPFLALPMEAGDYAKTLTTTQKTLL